MFPCEAGHVTCLDCFRQYCISRLLERQFLEHPNGGYTLQCPVACTNSYIEDVHHFKLLSKEQYERYQRFATEEYVLRNGGVLCPQPGCGMGLLIDAECKRVQCQSGCGVSASRLFPFRNALIRSVSVRFLSQLPAGLSLRRMSGNAATKCGCRSKLYH